MREKKTYVKEKMRSINFFLIAFSTNRFFFLFLDLFLLLLILRVYSRRFYRRFENYFKHLCAVSHFSKISVTFSFFTQFTILLSFILFLLFIPHFSLLCRRRSEFIFLFFHLRRYEAPIKPREQSPRLLVVSCAVLGETRVVQKYAETIFQSDEKKNIYTRVYIK